MDVEVVFKVVDWEHDDFKATLPGGSTLGHVRRLLIARYGHMRRLQLWKRKPFTLENALGDMRATLQQCGLTAPSARAVGTGHVVVHVDFAPVATTVLKVSSPLPAVSHASTVMRHLNSQRAATAPSSHLPVVRSPRSGPLPACPATASGAVCSATDAAVTVPAATPSDDTPETRSPRSLSSPAVPAAKPKKALPSYMRATTSSGRGAADGRARATAQRAALSSARAKRAVPVVNKRTQYCEFFRELQPRLVRLHPKWSRPRIAKRVGQLYRSGISVADVADQLDAEAAKKGLLSPNGGAGGGAGKASGVAGGDAGGDATAASDGGAEGARVKGKLAWGKLKKVATPKLAGKPNFGIANVVLSLITRIKSGGTSKDWLEREWSSLAIHNGKFISLSELYRWLDARYPELNQSRYAVKAAYRATCKRHQAQIRQVTKSREGMAHHHASARQRSKDLIARRERALRLAQKKKKVSGSEFFTVHKDEFRILLRNLCFYQKVWMMFTDVDVNSDRRLDVHEVRELMKRLNGGQDLSDAEAAEAFAEMDDNINGTVVFEEFCTWYAHASCPLEEDEDNEHRRRSAVSDGKNLHAVYDDVARVYESHPGCVSCTVVKIPSRLGNTTKLHAILVVTSTVGIGTSEELKAWGAESLAPELVPSSFETMDQLAMEHERREKERRSSTHTTQKRKKTASKPGLDGLGALSSSSGGSDKFDAAAELPRGSPLKSTRRKRPVRRASVILT